MMRLSTRKARSNGVGAVILMALSSPVFALHLVPDRLDDSHFTSGPCPVTQPPDGTSCPLGATTCPLHPNVQAAVIPGTTLVDPTREYSQLAIQGWNIDYSTLRKHRRRSPLARWYATCFDTNGVFTVANNKNCKFSVTPADLKFLRE